MPVHANYQPFLTDRAPSGGFTVTFGEQETLPLPDGEPLSCNKLFAAYAAGDCPTRLYHDYDTAEPYALVSADLRQGDVRVRYLSGKRALFNFFGSCFFHIPLEEMLLSRGRMVLHASLVASPFGGLLFSGPSGIGKSTQAELWKSLEGSRLINGDRPILGKQDGRWLAYGSPYAGSSKCYVNESVPIAAIVMLEQGEKCSIRRLGPVESFRYLLANAILNVWNADFMQQACGFLSDLSAGVPVYHMTCTPDAQAVETLKAELGSEEERENE